MTNDLQPPPAADDVAVAIDAGGSSTRARARSGGAVVHEGTGGPGNPVSADLPTLRASYDAALAGCPPADRIVACVSGTTHEPMRALIETLLAERFPGAVVRVLPDYLAPIMAAPPRTDLCIVAGTGSVVCSRDPAGGYRVTGGRGWILGDHGSATRLGRAALEYFVADPRRVPAAFAGAVRNIAGGSDWQTVVRAVHGVPNPAPLLARAAPLLTSAAEDQQHWAIGLLDDQMSALARSTAWHIQQHLPGTQEVSAILSGGVWTSRAARSSFTRALERATSRAVTVSQERIDPLDGAVRLAGEIDP